MGSIYKRGTRTKPRYYLYFNTGSKYVMRAAGGVTTKEKAREELARIELAIARGEPWEVAPVVSSDMGSLLERWSASLTNRSAYEDRLIIRRDLVPRWKKYQLAQVTVAEVIVWLEELAETTMASQTQRHRLGLLSRFFSWAIGAQLAEVNPCRQVPRDKAPPARSEKEIPWLEDDSKVPDIMEGLGPDLGLIYYLARFSGLREGEAAGLRMSDLDFLSEGILRVRHSFGGPLKEHGPRHEKEVKWVPAPSDAADVLAMHLKRRKLHGAKPEDLVFPYQHPGKGKARTVTTFAGWHPKQIRTTWRKVADGLGLPKELTFYAASRHTFISAALKAGESLDEVSQAVGHANPATTLKSYAHYVRKTFSPGLRQGLAVKK